MYAQVEEAATAKNFKLEVGKGNEGDTIGRRIVYVYDTATFPFYQAEVYHQFHDDFQSPAYGKKYNSLAQMAFDDGRLKITGCPDRVWVFSQQSCVCGGDNVMFVCISWVHGSFGGNALVLVTHNVLTCTLRKNILNYYKHTRHTHIPPMMFTSL